MYSQDTAYSSSSSRRRNYNDDDSKAEHKDNDDEDENKIVINNINQLLPKSKKMCLPSQGVPGKPLLNSHKIKVEVKNENSPNDEESNKTIESSKSKAYNLSESQVRALDAIISRKSVFFTGPAGSGKSFILMLLQQVLELCGDGDKIVS